MTAVDQLTIAVLPNGLVSRSEAAKFLGRKPVTLAAWATEKRGPEPINVQGRIFYRLEDLKRLSLGEGVPA